MVSRRGQQYGHQQSPLLSILPPFGLVAPVIPSHSSPPFLFLSHSSLELLSFSPPVHASPRFSVHDFSSPLPPVSSLEQGTQTWQVFTCVRARNGGSLRLTLLAPRVELKIRVVPRGLPTPSRNSIGDGMEEKE